MNKAALKKLEDEYLKKGKTDYDAGRLTFAAKDYAQAQGAALGLLANIDGAYFCELCKRAYEPEEINGVRKLKAFKGYTVDLRLQEFRELERGKQQQFIPFASLEGRALLYLMHQEVMR